MLNKFLNSKTKTVTFAAFLLAGFALLSRIFGLIRNNLLGNLFPKSQSDIYLAAFCLPDFVYGLLVSGGIVAAFLPVFSSYFKKSKEEAEILTNNVLTVFLVALCLISIILAVFAPSIVKLVVPGFTSQQKELTVTLSRIMFLSPILLGMSAIFSGILQYFDLFFVYSLAPVFYNISIIIGILFLAPIFGLKGLAFGVVLGAFLHLLIQIPPAVKMGFIPHFSFELKSPGLKRIFQLMIPRSIGAAAYQINLIVITAIASTLSVGTIRAFNFSNDLYSVPIGLIGVSFATAIFPTLSRNFADKQKEKFLENFSSVFSQILFLVIPLTFSLFLLRAHLVRLLYGTKILGPGFFDWRDTRLIAASLGVFAVSIFAGCLIPFLARVFFSSQDTKTPVKIALITMALNIGLALFFVWLLKFPNVFKGALISFLELKGIDDVTLIGLPLALSGSAVFQFFLLCFYLKRKVLGLSFQHIYLSLAKILIASLLMAALTYAALQAGALLFNTRTVLGLLLQTVLAIIVGAGAYIFFSLCLKSQELKTIWSSMKEQFRH